MPIRLGRLQAAEHEAFVTLLAERAGLATREVVTAAATIDDDALLVLRGEALPAADLLVEQIDDAFLGGAWRALAVLDIAKIAHQQIDATAVVVTGGAVRSMNYGRPRPVRPTTSSSLPTASSSSSPQRASRVPSARFAVRWTRSEPTKKKPWSSCSPTCRRQPSARSFAVELKATETDVDDLRDEVVAATGHRATGPCQVPPGHLVGGSAARAARVRELHDHRCGEWGGLGRGAVTLPSRPGGGSSSDCSWLSSHA